MMAEKMTMKTVLKWAAALAAVTTFGGAFAADPGELPLKSSRIETPMSKGTLPLDTRTLLRYQLVRARWARLSESLGTQRNFDWTM